MAQLGADVEQLDDLARLFNQSAEQLGTIISQLDGCVGSVWWQGPDADVFRNEWQGQFKSQMANLSEALVQTGGHVTQQANQQRQASGAA